MRYCLIVLPLVLLFVLAPQALAQDILACPKSKLAPLVISDSNSRANMLCLINRDRELAGAQPLRVSSQLESTAQKYATRMIFEHFFSHIDPQGGRFITRLRKSGYLKGVYLYLAAENIAWGSGLSGSPYLIDLAVNRSPAHRSNLINKNFRHVGIGVTPGSPPGGTTGATWSIVFGKRTYR